MKKFFKKMLIKSTAILCSAMLLFLSPCAGYLGASSMEYVQAVELAVAEGGAYILELIIALLASLSVGVAYENREAIGDAFTSYLETPDLIAVPMQDPCIQVYNDNTNTATDISWQDVLDSLHEFHDEAVDDLTGVYIKYCPALLNSIDDFIADVLSGDVVIPELSTELIDDTFSDFESIQNADGSYNISGFANTTFLHSTRGTYFSFLFSGESTKFHPFGIVTDNGNYDFYGYCVYIYRYDNGGCYSHNVSYKQYLDGKFNRTGGASSFYVDQGYGINIPLFPSVNAALAAFKANDFSNALNYARSIDSAIESDDIPPFTKSWRQGELERLLNSLDATGIGSYGRGISIDNWISELPWIRLESLRKYSRSLDDLYRQMIDDIINGNYDSAKGIPGTYSEAWEQTISEAWDNVEQSTDAVPGESEKDKPAEGEDEDKDDPEGGGGGSGDSNNNQEEPPEGKKGLSPERLEYYLRQAIKNTDSDTVMLGRTGHYDVIAENAEYTYFKMEPDVWDALVEEAAGNYGEIWQINQQFLDEQIALEKEILLTDDPYEGYYFPDGSPQFYQRELEYLIQLGYFFEQVGESIWKALRK